MNGDVRVIQPMGDGSFVLGGSIAYYNGERVTQLLRLQSNGTRVPFPVTVSGAVSVMALDSGWLYLGGDFQVVNGTSIPFLARVNAATGAVDATWRPAPNGDPTDFAIAPGGLVVAGAFSSVRGLPRSRMALISTSGASAGRAVDTWKCDADAQVESVVVNAGKVYLGGRFKKLNSTVIQYLARVDAASGAVEAAWNPTPQFHVYDLATDGTHLYCAGSFSRIGSGGPAFLTRLTLASGSVDGSWNPAPDGLVTDVVISGDSVYAAGTWQTFGGVAHRWIGRAVKATGAGDPAWVPPVDGGVLALAPDGASGVWAGGRFDSGGTGAGFARFTNSQGTSAPAYPGRVENTGEVKVVRADPSGGWFVGGNFDRVNGLSKRALFRLLPTRTPDAAWSAGLGGFYPAVNGMEVIPDAAGGAEIMIAGQFEVKPASLVLYNCLRLKTATGVVQQGFAPQPDNIVNALVKQGNQWVIGGGFDKCFNTTVPNLARFDITGLIDSGWKPQPNAPVHSLLVDGADLYAGGEFTTFGKAPVIYPAKYLVRVPVMTPDPAWQPQPDQAVFAMASDGTYIYAGGRFTKMARAKRKYLAQIPLGGAGTATAWNPNPNGAVYGLHLSATHLYAGGLHTQIANFVWPKLARFSRTSLALDTTFQSTGEQFGLVRSIAPQTDGSIFVGGSFDGWDDDFSKSTFVRITPAAGSPLALRQVPPPSGDPELELLESYFAASVDPRSAVQPLADGTGATWEESGSLPSGLVARVQWSHDLEQWHESGDSAGGLTHTIVIEADGTHRTARVVTDGTPNDGRPPPLFLRVVITPGETPAMPQP